jgi:hypothetical protein
MGRPWRNDSGIYANPVAPAIDLLQQTEIVGAVRARAANSHPPLEGQGNRMWI